jgi:ubiquitin C-terminal hydrolase
MIYRNDHNKTYFKSGSLTFKRENGISGLYNMGNTCFINTAI